MIIGQDFYTKDGYLQLLDSGEEINGRTWTQLRSLLAKGAPGAQPVFLQMHGWGFDLMVV